MNPVSPVLPNCKVKEVCYAENQPQYLPLPAIVMSGMEKEVLTRWELSNEEKIALLSGGQIYLSIWTFGQHLQPIKLRVAQPEEIVEEYRLVPLTVNNTAPSTLVIESSEPNYHEVETKALGEDSGKDCEYEH